MKSLSFSNAPQRNTNEVLALVAQAIKRYWRIAVGPAVVLCGLIITFSIAVPDYYSASSLLYIQPQRVQTKIVQEPDEREMRSRLDSIVQEILSRPRLRAIIEKFDLYPSLRGPKGIESAIYTLRKKVNITPVKSPTGLELLQTFRLTFTHGNPETAYRVTQAVTNLFIEESLLSRRTEIQSTEEFIDAQLYDARKKLEETEAMVQKFVSGNFKQLPEHLNAAIARLENLQAQLTANSQMISANNVRRQSLQTELVTARSSGAGLPSARETSSDPNEAVAQLESALVVLQSKYSDAHPDVIKTKQRIKALKAQLGSGSSGGKSAPAASSPVVRSIRSQINEVDAQLAALQKENASLKKSIEVLQVDIQAMPLKEQELLKIKRDYTNVKANYERLLAAKEDASLQNSLMQSQKASQFKIIEPAELPAFPAGPNRKLFMTAGIAVSGILFVSLLMLLFFLNGAYKDRDEMESETGLPVLGLIPPMTTPETVAYQKRLTSVSVFASALSLASGSLLIVFLINRV
ncbi:MAG: hypothetical protein KDD66_05855 [Bdellovibrionales bacterium]|nr:hypothetical protein [Bdellovibrionales bacterium]